jgi:hypothetical protein
MFLNRCFVFNNDWSVFDFSVMNFDGLFNHFFDYSFDLSSWVVGGTSLFLFLFGFVDTLLLLFFARFAFFWLFLLLARFFISFVTMRGLSILSWCCFNNFCTLLSFMVSLCFLDLLLSCLLLCYFCFSFSFFGSFLS